VGHVPNGTISEAGFQVHIAIVDYAKDESGIALLNGLIIMALLTALGTYTIIELHLNYLKATGS
jgi:hypothetical protein